MYNSITLPGVIMRIWDGTSTTAQRILCNIYGVIAVAGRPGAGIGTTWNTRLASKKVEGGELESQRGVFKGLMNVQYQPGYSVTIYWELLEICEPTYESFGTQDRKLVAGPEPVVQIANVKACQKVEQSSICRGTSCPRNVDDMEEI